jgi:hypothetical protein
MIVYLTISNPAAIYYSLGTILIGGVTYLIISRKKES